MKLPEPPKHNAEQLQHPKGRRSKFQGDLIRPVDKQGFQQRRKASGLSIVEGSKANPNSRQVELASPIGDDQHSNRPDITGARPQSGHQYTPAFQRDLTPRQAAQVFKPRKRR